MAAGLGALFATIASPSADAAGPVYAVAPVPGYAGAFIGKDSEARACLLIEASGRPPRKRAPIRLETLHVQFDVRCRVRAGHAPEATGAFTVVMCRARDGETIRYFLHVCGAVLRLAGRAFDPQTIGSTIHRLAAMFRQLQKPPVRSLNGLFGELYVIWRSANPRRTLAAWRLDDMARFDFSDGPARLDVKTTTTRVRAHTCTYDQCNPPPGTTAVAASLFVEQVAAGMSMRSLVEEIENAIGDEAELALKLHEVVAATLGRSVNEAMEAAFDLALADGSLRFYDLRSVPAIRDVLPPGVSDLHFRSDFSGTAPANTEMLAAHSPELANFLPRSIDPDIAV